MLKIVTAPNSILSLNSKPVPKINKSILNLIEEMKQTLLAAKDPEGVGLAAPQVGQPLRMFITKPNQKSQIQVFINPKIEKHIAPEVGKKQQVKQSAKTARAKEKSGIDKDTQLEGCLSLPNIWGGVERSPSVTLSYLDQLGKKHSKTFKGLSAVIVQHEIDHLNGILFPKRVLEQKGTLYKSHKNEKGEDVFEEIEI